MTQSFLLSCISEPLEIRSRTSHTSPSATDSVPKGRQDEGASSVPKRRREDDNADPKYRNVDGKAYYETEGKKGYLLILNSTTNRTNTDRDVKNLKEFFEDKLRFDTFDPRAQESDDLSTEKLTGCLETAKASISGGFSSMYYYFVCIILSHGNESGIATKDGIKPVDEVVKIFSNTLTGKPKLFFIQTCRGLNTTDHKSVDDEADDNAIDDVNDSVPDDESDEMIKVQRYPDTLVASATTRGTEAFRRSNVGSWFILKMIKEFRENYTRDHVEEMLITVRQKVAKMYSVDFKSMQMPCVESTLARRL